MKYFLLVYGQRTGSLTAEEYPAGAGHIALERRFELERMHRSDPSVEVVLLAASSYEDLQRTHGRYFKSAKDLASAT